MNYNAVSYYSQAKNLQNIFFVMLKQFLKMQYLNIIYYSSFGTFYLKVSQKVSRKVL
jgi:hypothetical protein